MDDLETTYRELGDIFWDVYTEYTDAEEPWDEAYFQGKKDGLRTALMMLSPLVDANKYWETSQETSRKGRVTKLQKATNLLRYAYKAIDDWRHFPSENDQDIRNWKTWVKISELIED